MDNRRGDKIVEIEGYLCELKSILPDNFEEYFGSLEKRAACERYFEKIVEAVTDLVFFIIKERGFELPESNMELFFVLARNDLISKELALNLSEAKGMRNWLAHRYGDVNDRLVFDSLKEGLVRDVEEFLGAVR